MKVDTRSGIARVVSESSQGYNVPQPVRNTITGELEVHTYDWVSLFQLLRFKTIPNILQYQVFRVDASNPKVVFLKEYSTEAEVSHAILETTTVVDPTVLPSEIVGKGLNLERQWYLYEKIRILCHSNLGRDITCPKPSQAKPKGSNKDAPSASTKSSESSSGIPESMPTSSAALQVSEPSRPGTKRRLCSVCANPGHNKKTCPERK